MMKYWSLTLLLSCSGWALATNAIWIDVASEQDYSVEHVVNAMHIPHTHIARSVSTRFPDKNTPLKLYDRDGHQAQQASEALHTLGYLKVTDTGALEQLKATGLSTLQTEPPLEDTALPALNLAQELPILRETEH